MKHKLGMQTHRAVNPSHNNNIVHDNQHSNNYDTMRPFVDQKENINKNTNIDYLLHLTNSDTKI